MIVMKPGASEQEIGHVVQRIEGAGARAHLSRGEEVTLIGAVCDHEHEQAVHELGLEAADGVDRVVPILKPYKLASLQMTHGEPSVFEIGGRR
jgi:3-deoxy-7-phosphoheptulonate synthase